MFLKDSKTIRLNYPVDETTDCSDKLHFESFSVAPHTHSHKKRINGCFLFQGDDFNSNGLFLFLLYEDHKEKEKKWNKSVIIYSPKSLQSCMTFFLLKNTKENNLKNVGNQTKFGAYWLSLCENKSILCSTGGHTGLQRQKCE